MKVGMPLVFIPCSALPAFVLERQGVGIPSSVLERQGVVVISLIHHSSPRHSSQAGSLSVSVFFVCLFLLRDKQDVAANSLFSFARRWGAYPLPFLREAREASHYMI